MEVDEIYRELLQCKADIDSILSSIESQNENPSIAIQQRISWLIGQFSKLLDQLKSISATMDQRSRGMWDTRILRFSEDLKVIRISCDRRLGLLFKSQREKEDRDFLFNNGASGRPTAGQSSLLSESSSLRSSHNIMDVIGDQSKAILDRLVSQNSTLKSARGKMYDLINSAKGGSAIAQSINTREKADALIVYGCMILTLLIFFALWYFIK